MNSDTENFKLQVVVAGKGRIQTPCLASFHGKDIISTAANTIDITMVNSTRTRTGGKGTTRNAHSFLSLSSHHHHHH
jgi:hypothetical protein